MRVPEWPQLLDAQIEAARDRVFAYGSFDCLLWAADVVAAMTGSDPAADFRGRYDSEEGALAILDEYGSLEAIITAHCGAPVHPSAAMRGDVVIAEVVVPGGGRAEAAGICTGLRCVFPTERGLLLTRRDRVRLAWNIP